VEHDSVPVDGVRDTDRMAYSSGANGGQITIVLNMPEKHGSRLGSTQAPRPSDACSKEQELVVAKMGEPKIPPHTNKGLLKRPAEGDSGG
jgi:hypothetical protein